MLVDGEVVAMDGEGRHMRFNTAFGSAPELDGKDAPAGVLRFSIS